MNSDRRKISLLTNGIIKKLYKVSQPYTSKKYSDEACENFHELVNVLSNVKGVEDLNYGGGRYHNYNDGGYKEYTIDITTVYGTKISGTIQCHFAGTMENPYSSYDMTVNFYKNTDEDIINEGMNNNLTISESELSNIIKESFEKILKLKL